MRNVDGLLTLAARHGSEAAPYSYDEFERRAARAHRAARRRERLAGGIAGAVVVMSLVGGLLYVATRTQSAATLAPATATREAVPEIHGISAEHWLASAPAEPVVVRPDSYAAVTSLEDRIAWIDDRLNDGLITGDLPVDPATLGRERARLINVLANLRYAQTLTE